MKTMCLLSNFPVQVDSYLVWFYYVVWPRYCRQRGALKTNSLHNILCLYQVKGSLKTIVIYLCLSLCGWYRCGIYGTSSYPKKSLNNREDVRIFTCLLLHMPYHNLCCEYMEFLVENVSILFKWIKTTVLYT